MSNLKGAILTLAGSLLLVVLILSLAGCATAPIREMDNGGSGKETWSVPVLGPLPAPGALFGSLSASDCEPAE